MTNSGQYKSLISVTDGENEDAEPRVFNPSGFTTPNGLVITVVRSISCPKMSMSLPCYCDVAYVVLIVLTSTKVFFVE